MMRPKHETRGNPPKWTITVLVGMLLLLVGPVIPLEGEEASSLQTISTFAGGASNVTITFPSGGTIATAGSLSLPTNGTVVSASLNISEAAGVEQNHSDLLAPALLAGGVASGISLVGDHLEVTNGTWQWWEEEDAALAADDRSNFTIGAGAHLLLDPLQPDADTAVLLRLEEQSGTSAADDGLGPNGLVSNGSWVPGAVGGGLHLNGAHALLEIPSAPAIDTAAPYTVELWARLWEDQVGVFLSRRAGAELGYALAVAPSGQIVAQVGLGPPGGITSVQSPLPYDDRQWHHLALQVAGGNFRLFVDGALAATTPLGGTAATGPGALYLGGNEAGAQVRMDIDQVRVVSRALAVGELSSTRHREGWIRSGEIATPLLSLGTIGVDLQLQPGATYAVAVENATSGQVLASGLLDGDTLPSDIGVLSTIRLNLTFATDQPVADIALLGWGIGTSLRPAMVEQPGVVMVNVTLDGNAQLKLDTWTEMARGPAARADAVAVWDDVDSCMLLFGGSDGQNQLDDLWSYYPSNDSWVQRSSGPSARKDAAAFWDPVDDRMVINGGWDGDLILGTWTYWPANDTWRDDGWGTNVANHTFTVWPTGHIGYIVGGGTDSYTDNWFIEWNMTGGGLTLSGGSQASRQGHSAVWDDQNDQLILFGGRNDTGLVDRLQLFEPGVGWTNGSVPLAPRDEHTAVWDPTAGEMLVAGGSDGPPLEEVWAYVPATQAWEQRPSLPSARTRHVAVYDSTADQMLVFGGYGADGTTLLDTLEIRRDQYRPSGEILLRPQRLPAGALGWDSVLIDATVPSQTSLTVEIRASTDGAAWGAWEPITDGVLPNVVQSLPFVEARAILTSSEVGSTPTLDGITLTYRLSAHEGNLTTADLEAPANLDWLGVELDPPEALPQIELRLSPDGGLSWELLGPSLQGLFSVPPSDLRLGIRMSPDAQGVTPRVNRVGITYHYWTLPVDPSIGIGEARLTVSSQFAEQRLNVTEMVRATYDLTEPVGDTVVIPMSIGSTSAGEVTVDALEVVIAVQPPPSTNHPPRVFAPTPPDGAILSKTDIDLSWETEDLDGDDLTFEVVLDGAVLVSGLTAQTYPLHSLQPDTAYLWQIVVRDGLVRAPGPTWTFSLTPQAGANEQPVVHLVAPADGTTLGSTTVKVSWSGTDPNGDELSYLVQLDQGEGLRDLDTTNLTTYVLRDLLDGITYRWAVRATDGQLNASLAGPWSFTIRIPPPNRVPILLTTELPDARVGERYSTTLDAHDPDNDTVHFVLLSGPGGLTIDEDGQLRWDVPARGVHDVVFEVNDGRLATNATLHLRVRPGSNPLTEGSMVLGVPLPWWLALLLAAGVGIAAVYLRSRWRERGELLGLSALGAEGGGSGPTHGGEDTDASAGRNAVLGGASAAQSGSDSIPTVPVVEEVDPFTIVEAFLIYRDGRLLLHRQSAQARAADSELLASMLVAIKTFVSESFESKGGLESFSFDQHTVVVEASPHLFLAAVVDGTPPPRLPEELQAVLDTIEGLYLGVLDGWDGATAPFAGCQTQLAMLFTYHEQFQFRKVREAVRLRSSLELTGGYVRLRVAIINDTPTVITEATLQLRYNRDSIRLERVEPELPRDGALIQVGTVRPQSKLTIDFYLDPVICQESYVDGTLTYYDFQGRLEHQDMRRRAVDIVCPLFYTPAAINVAMVRRIIEQAPEHDGRIYQAPEGMTAPRVLDIAEEVILGHAVRRVRRLEQETPTAIAEAWFYGQVQQSTEEVVLRATAREETGTLEVFVASTNIASMTGLLAELAHQLRGRKEGLSPVVDDLLQEQLQRSARLLDGIDRLSAESDPLAPYSLLGAMDLNDLEDE